MPKRTKKIIGLADWIERNIVLPDTGAEPGPMRLWPWQREITDALDDPSIERVSLLKSARVGFSSLLTAAIGYHVAERPAAILYLLPTESDCRGFVVDDLEPMFDASPVLRGRLGGPSIARASRNTITHRLFKGGSLKVVAGKAPRNLRRHTAKILIVDEADAIEQSAEGDPIGLAERRTMTFADRKIVVGGTPIDEATSHVTRCYRESDQRVFELPCPECGCFTEILWRHIEWEPDRPQTARFRCPHCEALIDEARKPEMLARARWRATAPHVVGHAGFKINSLVSRLPTTTWAKLAAEFLRVKDDPARLKVFVNTLLGEPWRDDDGDGADEGALAARAEPFDLERVPPDVLALTAGVDVQEERLECAIIGHTSNGAALVLDHRAIWGAVDDDATWRELDAHLKARVQHPHGGALRIDAAVIDAGSGGHFDRVMSFCAARASRRVLAGKGAAGFSRPAIAPSKTARGRLWIVGVDSLKTQIFARLARGGSIRFSDGLPRVYFEQLCSERRIVRMTRGRPVARFERVPGRRAEALDALVYALAARAALSINFSERSDDMRRPASAPPTKAPDGAIRSNWMNRQSSNWHGWR